MSEEKKGDPNCHCEFCDFKHDHKGCLEWLRNSSENKDKVIEVKFDSTKEKIFIFTTRFLTTKETAGYLKLFNSMNEAKIFLLPADLIESVKVIRDIKEEAKEGEQ